MRTVGMVLQDARKEKNLSREDLQAQTKIKKEFIVAIEKEKWEKLPEYPVVTGFVKRIARTLGLDEGQMIALLRRDYPPKNLPINPKPDVGNRFTWSPKLTFVTGVIIVFLAVSGYLIYQYFNFIKPPLLRLEEPTDGQIVKEEQLKVKGFTDSEATVTINNQPVLVGEDGGFSSEIEIFEGTEEIVVVARSRSGKETVVKRKIEPELEDNL